MNREHLGLDARGNVVACCKQCNSRKGGTIDFEEFLRREYPEHIASARIGEIKQFMTDNNYVPLDVDDPQIKTLIEKARLDLEKLANICGAEILAVLKARPT